MKKLAIVLLSGFLFLAVHAPALAAPNNEHKAENNPQKVAYYPIGLHAIPTDPVTYVVGTNIVTTRGNTGQIQAWYTGEDGRGIHSVWNISKEGSCKGDWVLIEDAYPVWGDYLTPDADYCVKVNSF